MPFTPSEFFMHNVGTCVLLITLVGVYRHCKNHSQVIPYSWCRRSVVHAHTHAQTHTRSALRLTLRGPSGLVSCKAVDSQSKEQSGDDVSDDDASKSARVQLYTVLAHCGERRERGGLDSFQDWGMTPPAALGSLMTRPKLQ